MRLIDPKSGQLEPIHHCLVEELQEKYKILLATITELCYTMTEPP